MLLSIRFQPSLFFFLNYHLEYRTDFVKSLKTIFEKAKYKNKHNDFINTIKRRFLIQIKLFIFSLVLNSHWRFYRNDVFRVYNAAVYNGVVRIIIIFVDFKWKITIPWWPVSNILFILWTQYFTLFMLYWYCCNRSAYNNNNIICNIINFIICLSRFCHVKFGVFHIGKIRFN